MLAILAASVLLGLVMAGLFNNAWLFIPWSAGPACLLFWLLRAVGDAGSLYQLMVGGAWREIRLSRVHALQVVDGITFQALKNQLPWSVCAAIGLASVAPTWGLPWLGAVLVGSVISSYYGQLSVVQRHVPMPPLSWKALVTLGMTGTFLTLSLTVLPFGLLLLPGAAWLTALLRCCAASSLDAIPEGHLFANDENKPGRRPLQWRPWSDNPIVGRETARESFRLGSNWLSAVNHFAGWGVLLALLPFGVSRLALDRGGQNVAQIVFLLELYVLFCGLLQAGRAANRVFRALAEERDRQTLDLLVVTSLRRHDFVDGWAQVGFVSRQLEMALITLGSVILAWWWNATGYQLSFIAYAGLLGLVLTVAGSYLGLLFGFRHCMRRKRKRDLIFPGCLLIWGAGTGSMVVLGIPYLLLQGAAAALVIVIARKQAMKALQG